MAQQIKQAFQDGAMAYLCGALENECPHKDRRLCAAWRMGWSQCQRYQGHTA
jgi:ribosome modulation factor